MLPKVLSALALTALLSVPAVAAQSNVTGKTVSPPWWETGIAYQIFVRSFLDTDGDGRGDLRGVTAKLDYLTNLGVTALYLNPFYPSYQYHGYDITDYYSVNPELGTMADFDELMKQAHQRGLKIILDMVFNHTSAQHPWFLDSATNAASPYRNWYVWSTNNLADEGWVNLVNAKMPPWNAFTAIPGAPRYSNYFYAAFNHTLPDLNLKNPEVVKEIRKISRFWLDKGADGLRMDAANYMIEDGPGKLQMNTSSTMAFWEDYSAWIRSVKPDVYLIGEVYKGQDIVKDYYRTGKGLNAFFNFSFEGKGSMSLHLGGTPKALDKLKEKVNQYLSFTGGGMPVTYLSLFLSSHDVGRYAESASTPEMQKLGAVAQFTLPGGMPYIYYGDEIGQREGEKKIGDAEKRNPMWWNGSMSNAGFTPKPKAWVLSMAKDLSVATNGVNVEDEQKEPLSVLATYKRLIELRKAAPALQKGSFETIGLDLAKDAGLASCFAFARKEGNNVAVVVLNASKTNVRFNQEISAPSVQAIAGKSKVTASLWSENLAAAPMEVTAALTAGRLEMELGPKGFIVVTMK